MATQGRRAGTRRRKADAAAGARVDTAGNAPAADELVQPAAANTSGDLAELLDERTVAISGSSRAFGLGRSIPAAVLGSLLVVGLAFGAAGPGGAPEQKSRTKDPAAPAAIDSSAGPLVGAASVEGQQGDGGVGEGDGDVGEADSGVAEPKDAPMVDDGSDEDQADKPDEPAADGEDGMDGKKDPQPDPTKKPQPDEPKEPKDPQPDPEPADAEPIALALGIKDEHPLLEWGACEGRHFDYYKVVRSKDSTATWPTGSNDEAVAVVERGGYRKAWDKAAPHGHKVWYRVFCVRKTDHGYKVVHASVTKGIVVPEETPPPDPIGLDLAAAVNEAGKVVLTWSACDVDGFAFYKIVRSDWNEDPSYLPWTDGTEVIGVVEDMDTTQWHDAAPDPGATAYYRVQCLGYHDGRKVLLGESGVVAVTTA